MTGRVPAAVAGRIADLSPLQRRLLAEKLRETASQAHRTSAAAPPPLLPAPRGGPLPLSFAQQRLWFLDRLEPGRKVYNQPAVFRLRGGLDIGTLLRGLREIVQRHEALRTVFGTVGGEAVQVIQPAAPVLGSVADLSGIPADRREEHARGLAVAEAERPFDLAKGPLVRVTLLALGAAEHILILNLHHIVGDGWSIGVLVREISSLYRAFSGGLPSPLPPLPCQYADFAVWQRGWMSGNVLEQQISYWKAQLAGMPAVHELPTDRPRPAAQSYRGARLPLRLPGELARGLRALAEQAGATLFMALLAAFQALLFRLSGRDDQVVGSPIANRNHAATEGLIGFFVNTLVLRTRLAAGLAFGDLLGRVRDVALAAYAHQDLPFERLVEELQPERHLSHSPVLQILLVLQNAPLPTLDLPGLTVAALDLDTGTAKFDLVLNLWEEGDSLGGLLEYSTDLFDADRIARFAAHFQTLLAAAVAAPRRAVAALPLLGEAERFQLLREWNDSAARGADVCVHRPVEEQARRTPDRTAAILGGELLTYRELDARANRLARRLRALGAEVDEPVGVLLDRSLELPVAVLAVLKAGAGYLPLDPGYPADRLAHMVESSGARLLLSMERLAVDLPGDGLHVLHLDRDDRRDRRDDLERARGAAAGQPGEEVECRAVPESLAYLIYTSGSTGRPKGIAMPHGVLANLLRWQVARSAGGAGARTLQFAPLSFDVSFQEMFATWWTGGTLVLIGNEQRRDPGELLRAIEQEGVERLFLPVVALQHLAEAIARGAPAPRRLREIYVAGEQLKITPQVAAWLAGSPACKLENQYGPSEGHAATAWPLRGPAGWWPLLPPIGRPIANARIHLTDARLQLVPIGVPGHLHIGGRPLARAYHADPALTARRFIPDPWSGEPGARLYATGDRACWQADGSLRFLGRTDHQVKIRGFRVEPDEIEALLAGHPQVREAAVAVRDDSTGMPRLIAFYVAADPRGAPAAADLRRWLGGQVPDFMLPGEIVRLDALPLTPSGKLDRLALPTPRGERGESAAPRTAPRTPLEDLVAGIWCDILGRGAVGGDDSFFDLGGHSLLATRVTSRIEQVLGTAVAVRSLFEHPTLAAFAAEVERLRRSRGDRPAPRERVLPPLTAASRDGGVPLSFAQERLWFLDRLEPGSAAYNLPIALTLHGPLQVAALAWSLGEEVRRHEALRTRFVAAAEAPVQEVDPAGTAALPVVDLAGLAAGGRRREAERLVLRDACRPFDLSRDAPVRFQLVRLGEHEHVLSLTLHHIAGDGWSLGIMVREISALYGARLAGRRAALDELPIQYADYACWQRRWLVGELLAAEVGYWRARLAGAPELLALPTDRRRPAVQSLRGEHVPLRLAPELVAGLGALGRCHGVTLFMTLLAAFAALLARWTGEEDIVVGSPVANRNRVEIEGLVGLFVNTLVLRVAVPGGLAMGDLLSAVRETTLDAYVHQDLPFEKLVAELAPERSRGHSPLFQAMLVLQNAPAGALELAGIEPSPFAVATGTAKFDLTLALGEQAGGGLGGALEHATDLFDRLTIERLLARLRQLLAAMAAAAPGEPVRALAPMAEAEKHQVLVEWNDSAARWEAAGCLHELIEAQVERTPEAVAVTIEGQALTYQALDRRAERLARRLRALGVGPEVVVAVLAERSTSLVAALLSVLKAGGAYLPLDPAHPAERLGLMLEDSGAAILLVAEGVAEPPGLAGRGKARRLALGSVHGAGSADRVRGGAGQDNAAYVIYTSGSTGRPKGVVNTHRGIVNRLLWAQTAHRLRPGDRLLQKTPISFDVSVWELFWPLLSGATLVLAAPGGHRDSAYLVEQVAASSITVLHFVPSMLAQFLEEEGLERCRGLVRVMASGEALSADLAGRFQARLGEPCGVELFNLYGPTEAAVEVTSWACRRDEQPWGVPIGRPIANLRIHLLDGSCAPVELGSVGELCIGGAGLARGYLGQSERTAERFIPDPFAGPEEAGGRLYRTGDRARYLADGAIDYLGRIDMQVKIRGVRIELGEIEAALARHPAIQAAAVVVREPGERGRSLVAYVVRAAGGEEVDAAGLRALLRRSLPEPMVPSWFVFLPALPLTPSGKLDRRALPAPERVERVPPQPLTPAEASLAEIWASLLGLDRMERDASFFDLGGHSLLTLQLRARIRAELGADLPLHALFEASTLAEQAAAVAAVAAAGHGGSAAPAASPAALTRQGVAGIAARRPVMTAAELEREAVLDREIAPAPGRLVEAGEPAHLLLTGATGFLGVFLLHEILLVYPRSVVHCLLRAADARAGMARLQGNLAAYELWDESFRHRLAPVPGDLARPLLGLARPRFDRLAAEVGAIIHNGAWVNAFHTYSTLRGANVLGTQEVLRLAVRSRLKPVHHVSTTSVLAAAGHGETPVLDEDADLAAGGGLAGGYAQSKWVAERLVRIAAERGVPVTIHRPGRIGGDSVRGRGSADDLVFRLIHRSIQLGAAPDLALRVEMSPVDWVSQALVHLSRLPESRGRTFHLVNPVEVPWREMLGWIEELGYPLRRLPWREWLQAQGAAAVARPGAAVFPLFEPLAEMSADEPAVLGWPRYGCPRTAAALEGSGIHRRPLDRGLLGLYLASFEKAGLLPARG